jgi:hypothetical protein
MNPREPARAPRLGVCFLLATSMLAACGGGRGQGPDFLVRGVGVVVETDAPFAQRSDFPARVEDTIDVALEYWGGSWSDLEGSTLTLVGAPSVKCEGKGGAGALGCYDGDIRVSTRDPGIGTFSCVEATVLVHEVGHAVLGDTMHDDPRWMEMDEVAAALSDRRGYSDAGEVPCIIYPSVWRHPLGKP